MLNSNWFKIVLLAQKISFGKKLNLRGIPCIVRRGGNISIGNNVTINSSFLSNLTGMNHRTIIVTRLPKSRVVIGDNVGISGATIYARDSIEIGNNVSIGSNAKILDSDFHPLDIESRNADDKSKIVDCPIVIEDDCFLGTDCIILKGTVLGRGCVVGAGAVVSGKYEPGSIIVGNPGKVVRIVNSEVKDNA